MLEGLETLCEVDVVREGGVERGGGGGGGGVCGGEEGGEKGRGVDEVLEVGESRGRGVSKGG